MTEKGPRLLNNGRLDHFLDNPKPNEKRLPASFVGLSMSAQAQYWQQSVHYDMDITMDVVNHQYDGEQQITYTNNSPDTLHKAYFHLYFNAFQPESMMDVRSRNIADPDRRVLDRIGGWGQIVSDTKTYVPSPKMGRLCDGMFKARF